MTNPVPMTEQGENDQIKQWELRIVKHKQMTPT